jgi:hypothetical protein
MASFWDSITAPFTGAPIEDAAAAQAARIAQGKRELESSYAAGRGELTNYYTQALQPYLQLQGQGAGGYDAYADATGANGPEGLARARANFSAMVQPDINMGVDAATRALSARGVAAGNIGADVSKMVGNELFGRYGDYVSRLAPWLGQGLNIAQGIGNIFTGLGSGLSGSYQGQGQQQLAALTGIGSAEAQGAMAPMVAGGNIWNLGLNLGKMAASGPLARAAGAAGTSLWNTATGNFLGPGSFTGGR